MDQDWFEKILAAERDGELTESELRELKAVCEKREDLRLQRAMDRKLGEMLNFGGPRKAPRGFSARVMDRLDAELAAEAKARAAAERATAATEAARQAALQPVSSMPKPAPKPSQVVMPVLPVTPPRAAPFPPPVGHAHKSPIPEMAAAKSAPRPVVKEERAPWWAMFFGSPMVRVGLGLATLAIFGFQIMLIRQDGARPKGPALETPGAPGTSANSGSSENTLQVASAVAETGVVEAVSAVEPDSASISPDVTPPRRETLEVAMVAPVEPAPERVEIPEPTAEPAPEPTRRPTPMPTASPEPTATPTPEPDVTPEPAEEPVEETRAAPVMVAAAQEAEPAEVSNPEPAVPTELVQEREIAIAAAAPAEVDDNRPDAKTALEEVLKRGERAPIIRIDLAHIQDARVASGAPRRDTLGTGREPSVKALVPGGASRSPAAAKAALREIEMALSSQGDIRRVHSDADGPGVTRLQAQLTPAGLRKFVKDIESSGIALRGGEAGAGTSGQYEFERGSLNVFGENADADDAGKITVELVIELPQ